MSNDVQGFQLIFQVFLYHFLLAKLATNSIRVNHRLSISQTSPRGHLFRKVTCLIRSMKVMTSGCQRKRLYKPRSWVFSDSIYDGIK